MVALALKVYLNITFLLISYFNLTVQLSMAIVSLRLCHTNIDLTLLLLSVQRVFNRWLAIQIYHFWMFSKHSELANAQGMKVIVFEEF